MKTSETEKCSEEEIYKKFAGYLWGSDLWFFNPNTGKEVSRKILIYSCITRRIPEPVKGMKPSNFKKIAAATSTHSVFILRSHKGYRIITLIKNLYPKHISYYTLYYVCSGSSKYGKLKKINFIVHVIFQTAIAKAEHLSKSLPTFKIKLYHLIVNLTSLNVSALIRRIFSFTN